MVYLYYSVDSYIFQDQDGEKYAIKRDTLIFNFHVHGYLRCPLRKRPMTTEEIISLLRISDRHDPEMSKIVRGYYSNFCDLESRKRQLSLTPEEYPEVKMAFIYLLTIGLLLIGWSDVNSELPRHVETNLDIVHVHLNCLPYFQALKSLPCYDRIRSISVVGKFCHSGYTIDDIFHELEDPDFYDITHYGKEIIVTSSLYLKRYFSYQKPEIDHLLAIF